MGQKVHPYGFRLGYTKPWKSRWFVERDYDKLLLEDIKLKNELKDKLKSAGVSAIEIERPGNKLRIIIKTARPGIIIGRKGAEIDKLKGDLQKRTSREVFVDIQEVHKPELDAQLVAGTLDLNGAHTRRLQLVLQFVLQLDVFEQQLVVIPLDEPARLPRLGVSEPKSVRMYLLSHKTPENLSCQWSAAS